MPDLRGYKNVEDFGLPQQSGSYLVITSEQKLFFANLHIADGRRTWRSSGPEGRLTDEQIIKWKLMRDVIAEGI